MPDIGGSDDCLAARAQLHGLRGKNHVSVQRRIACRLAALFSSRCPEPRGLYHHLRCDRRVGKQPLQGIQPGKTSGLVGPQQLAPHFIVRNSGTTTRVPLNTRAASQSLHSSFSWELLGFVIIPSGPASRRTMHSRKELVAGGAIFIESLAQGLERGSLLGFVVPHPFLQQSDEGNRVVQPRCGWGIWNSRELESSLVGSGISLPRLYNAGVIDPTKVTRTALQNAASIASLMLTTGAILTHSRRLHGAPLRLTGVLAQIDNSFLRLV